VNSTLVSIDEAHIETPTATTKPAVMLETH
jgi:hypothetical protein